MPLAEVTPKVMLVADDFQPEEELGVKVRGVWGAGGMGVARIVLGPGIKLVRAHWRGDHRAVGVDRAHDSRSS